MIQELEEIMEENEKRQNAESVTVTLWPSEAEWVVRAAKSPRIRKELLDIGYTETLRIIEKIAAQIDSSGAAR